MKKEANKKTCLQPMPKVLVSCRDAKGEDNVLAVGYCCNCSFDPPMVMIGIDPTHYSYHMIKEGGCFVVNLTTKDYVKTFEYLGTHSKSEENKLKEIDVKMGDAVKVNARILLDCPINIECTIVDSIVTGSHEMFVGKVEYVHANEELIKPDGDIEFSKVDFL